ncbi:hypothetical protein AKO1_003120 [Acrasis kona]|uniref:YwbE family protein n=1 Tax=Acrasis kona TaxID=1008807 RepID=A0AAW2ZA25_9EUKA
MKQIQSSNSSTSVKVKTKQHGVKSSGTNRNDVKPGTIVNIVLKHHQRTGERTKGIVKEILTNSIKHPRGIKVRLEDGAVGRVQEIFN